MDLFVIFVEQLLYCVFVWVGFLNLLVVYLMALGFEYGSEEDLGWF